MQKYQDKVKAILEALPYIKKFAEATVVIKYGGSAMLDDELKKAVARDITLLSYIGMKPVIIHGGGKEIDKWLEKIDLKPLNLSKKDYSISATLNSNFSANLYNFSANLYNFC